MINSSPRPHLELCAFETDFIKQCLNDSLLFDPLLAIRSLRSTRREATRCAISVPLTDMLTLRHGW